MFREHGGHLYSSWRELLHPTGSALTSLPSPQSAHSFGRACACQPKACLSVSVQSPGTAKQTPQNATNCLRTLSALSSSSAVIRTCRSSLSEGSGFASFLLRPSLTLPRPRIAILQLVSCSMPHAQATSTLILWSGQEHQQLSTVGAAGAHAQGRCASVTSTCAASVNYRQRTLAHPLHSLLRVATWTDNEPDEVVPRVLFQRYAQSPVLFLRPVICWRLEGGVGLDHLGDQLLQSCAADAQAHKGQSSEMMSCSGRDQRLLRCHTGALPPSCSQAV